MQGGETIKSSVLSCFARPVLQNKTKLKEAVLFFGLELFVSGIFSFAAVGEPHGREPVQQLQHDGEQQDASL